MTYRDEFPDFDPATMPAIPADWTGISWHNDGCPSWNTGNGLVVCVDYAAPEQREFPEGPRFCVIVDPAISDHNEDLFQSDDWEAVLAFAEGRAA